MELSTYAVQGKLQGRKQYQQAGHKFQRVWGGISTHCPDRGIQRWRADRQLPATGAEGKGEPLLVETRLPFRVMEMLRHETEAAGAERHATARFKTVNFTLWKFHLNKKVFNNRNTYHPKKKKCLSIIVSWKSLGAPMPGC